MLHKNNKGGRKEKRKEDRRNVKNERKGDKETAAMAEAAVKRLKIRTTMWWEN